MEKPTEKFSLTHKEILAEARGEMVAMIAKVEQKSNELAIDRIALKALEKKVEDLTERLVATPRQAAMARLNQIGYATRNDTAQHWLLRDNHTARSLPNDPELALEVVELEHFLWGYSSLATKSGKQLKSWFHMHSEPWTELKPKVEAWLKENHQ